MIEFFSEYGLFLAKSVTLVVAVLVIIGSIASLAQRNRGQRDGHVEIRRLNEELDNRLWAMREAVLEPAAFKQKVKKWKKEEKQRHKELEKAQKAGEEEAPRGRTFILDFHGDIRASAVSSLREAVTAVLAIAEKGDEVALRLESPGGVVHGYGLAASQLQRIRAAEVPLVVCVDKVAASGGYMMACVAERIIAAPFAILGSIGVVAQIPNFHRLLKRNHVDFEVLTAGEFKRTLTVFGENTDKGRAKFLEDLEDTHDLFKEFVSENRPAVDISSVATGEIWFGQRALDKNLVDEISTSDDWLVKRSKDRDLFEVRWVEKKSLPERLGFATEEVIDRLLLRWWDRLNNSRFLQ